MIAKIGQFPIPEIWTNDPVHYFFEKHQILGEYLKKFSADLTQKLIKLQKIPRIIKHTTTEESIAFFSKYKISSAVITKISPKDQKISKIRVQMCLKLGRNFMPCFGNMKHPFALKSNAFFLRYTFSCSDFVKNVGIRNDFSETDLQIMKECATRI